MTPNQKPSIKHLGSRIQHLGSKLLLTITFCLLTFTFTTTDIFAQDYWNMAGGNPARTGWIDTGQIPTNNLLWARPIESYIDQKVQIITAQNQVYVSTSDGLVVLHADTGNLLWQYDTQLPLGHSPTIDTTTSPPTVYVGGMDKKLYALNSQSGQLLWAFDQANAGFATNPLVIDNKVIVGNRDGGLYAIHRHGTPSQGELAWKFQTQGPVLFSPAYHNNRIFIASNDNHAYAINLNGSQIWKSAKLPGDGFYSYYPVIYRDKVIFSTTYVKGSHVSNEFRARQVCPGGGQPCYFEPIIEGDPLGSVDGTLIGVVEPPTDWSGNWHTLYPWRVIGHFGNNPDNSDPLFFKPENRPLVVLNQSNGQEFTFEISPDDFFTESFQAYIPFSFWARYGTLNPVIVDPDDNLVYGQAPVGCCSDTKGKVYGWNIDHPSRLIITGASASVPNQTISQTGGWAAMAEPQALSGMLNRIFRNLCCDRVGDSFSVTQSVTTQYWHYNLGHQIPGYDFLWQISPTNIARHIGWYSGLTDTASGIYHSHGNQAPLTPHNDKMFTHRSNVVIAYGPGTNQGMLEIIPKPQVATEVNTPSLAELTSRLNQEIEKIVSVGTHLRPGIQATGALGNYSSNRQGFENYFENPGDTLYTLSYAYPHLGSSLQNQVKSYLSQQLIPDYFDTNPDSSNPTMYAKMGYDEGEPREWFDFPQELYDGLRFKTKTTNPGAWLWNYPQHNFYAMYLYARNIPDVDTERLYQLAKNRIQVPVPTPNPNQFPGGHADYFTKEAFEHNAWITGYIGFLKLQELAGMDSIDADLRNQVSQEKDVLITLRSSTFDKETPWVNFDTGFANNYKKALDVARNFMFLTPELGQAYRQNSTLYNKAVSAIDFYNYIAPYWFVARYESTPVENTFQHLYNSPALFQAKAWIQLETRQELYKYLDTPMFDRGDLFYIQNLIATIEAPTDGTPEPPTPTPHPADLNQDGVVNIFDLNHVISQISTLGYSIYQVVLTHFGKIL